MMDFLDALTIEQFQADDPFDEDPVVFIGPRHYWGETDECQKRLQLKLLRSYSFWFEQFQLLLSDSWPRCASLKYADSNNSRRTYGSVSGSGGDESPLDAVYQGLTPMPVLVRSDEEDRPGYALSLSN
jgi:hypothetical protein